MSAKLRDVKIAPAPGVPTTAEIFEAGKSKLLRNANEWSAELGGGSRPFLLIKCGCGVCGFWTVCSADWRELDEDATTAGSKTGT